MKKRYHVLRQILLLSALLLPALSTQAQWSTATLSIARRSPGAASAGGKVFFAGGDFNSGHTNAVDIYDTGTNTWSTATLSLGRYSLSAASAGSKVFFGGGIAYSESGPGLVYTNRVDIFDTATNTWTTAALSQPRAYLTATSAGGKVFFAGGMLSNSAPSDLVDIYDTATNTWSVASLSQARYSLSATSAGSKVFFAGGSSSSHSSVVDIYDTATNTWSVASLSEARTLPGATSTGSKVFFGGGYAYSGASSAVDIYDMGTNTWSTATLSMGRYAVTGASEGGKVFFAGGGIFTSPYATNVVDIYDVATNTWSTSTLSQDRYYLSAASAGGKVLFAGGMRHVDGNPGTMTNAVDIYSVTTPTQITQEPTPASQSICAGGTASTSVTATGQLLTYQWYRNNPNTDEPVAGQTTATLFLSNTNMSQSGMYYLRVNGEGGVVWSSAFMLTVNPSFSYYADADGDGFGNPSSLTTICSSTPPPGFVSDHSDCDDSRRLYADQDGDGFGAGPAVACGVALNTDCDDTNAANTPTTIINQPTSLAVEEKQTATFSVTATGTNLTYQWYFKGTTPAHELKKETSATLTIKNAKPGDAKPSDAGMYYVLVRGVCGNILSSGAVLTVSSKKGRLAAHELLSPLGVTVLGNPLISSQLEVTVTGAEGMPLQLQLTDLGGRVITRQQIEQAGALETRRLEVGPQPSGLLFLRVSTPTRSQVVKVVRQ